MCSMTKFQALKKELEWHLIAKKLKGVIRAGVPHPLFRGCTGIPSFQYIVTEKCNKTRKFAFLGGMGTPRLPQAPPHFGRLRQPCIRVILEAYVSRLSKIKCILFVPLLCLILIRQDKFWCFQWLRDLRKYEAFDSSASKSNSIVTLFVKQTLSVWSSNINLSFDRKTLKH